MPLIFFVKETNMAIQVQKDLQFNGVRNDMLTKYLGEFLGRHDENYEDTLSASLRAELLRTLGSTEAHIGKEMLDAAVGADATEYLSSLDLSSLMHLAADVADVAISTETSEEVSEVVL
jgi:hypothetical protein